MLKIMQRLFNNKKASVKAQSTLEYAIIITVVIAALTAMSVYVQRSVQGTLKVMEKQINNEPK